MYPGPRLIFHHYDLHCDPLVLLSPDLFSDHLLYIFNKSEKTDFIAILLPEEFVLRNTDDVGSNLNFISIIKPHAPVSVSLFTLSVSPLHSCIAIKLAWPALLSEYYYPGPVSQSTLIFLSGPRVAVEPYFSRAGSRDTRPLLVSPPSAHFHSHPALSLPKNFIKNQATNTVALVQILVLVIQRIKEVILWTCSIL